MIEKKEVQLNSKKVIFILSLGHTGSTLLDYVLSSAENCFGLGEIYAMQKDKFRNGSHPLCSIDGYDCNFWDKSTTDEIKKIIRPRGYYDTLLKRFRSDRSTIKLYRFLFKKVNKDFLIDSSKNILWIDSALNQLKRSKIQASIIYLKRYPPAIVAGWLRKYPEQGLIEITKRLSLQNHKMNQFYASLKIEKQEVIYEDLTETPSNSFEGMFNSLGIDFSPEYLDYFKYDHHHVAGNSGTATLIRNYQQLTGDESIYASKDYYKSHPLKIKVDKRWMSELTDQEIKYVLQSFES